MSDGVVTEKNKVKSLQGEILKVVGNKRHRKPLVTGYWSTLRKDFFRIDGRTKIGGKIKRSWASWVEYVKERTGEDPTLPMFALIKLIVTGDLIDELGTVRFLKGDNHGSQNHLDATRNSKRLNILALETLIGQHKGNSKILDLNKYMAEKYPETKEQREHAQERRSE